ncbi:hypothetical protein [Salipiger aestuarii]|uniref:hypothetical protein n=1 Tax=Salipiger aestuarii TaxID=568098 RepID=UPI00123A7B6F|nr:hypothetical protein [Salipiger aestuarii]
MASKYAALRGGHRTKLAFALCRVADLCQPLCIDRMHWRTGILRADFVHLDTPPPNAVLRIAVDTHVHLYPGADAGRALTAGFGNLTAARQNADRLMLVLTETSRDCAFEDLAAGRRVARGWSCDRVAADPAALRATNLRKNSQGLLLLAGRQVQTREGIEVLALATNERFEDGLPIRTVLAQLHTRRIPAVLPWGVGKWLGRRGAEVEDLLAGAGGHGLMLGDNAGRPRIWRTPSLFLQAMRDGVPVLPGSDPLPLPGAEEGIGAFGCQIDAPLDETRPASSLREHLFTLRGQPVQIGKRRGLPAVVSEQIALRRRRIRTTRAGGIS